MPYWDNYTDFDGLERLGEVEVDNEPYSFNLIGLWKGAEGYYLGTDSGCSCPTPWESYAKADLTGPLTAEQAKEEVIAMVAAQREYQYGSDGITDAQVEQFLAVVQ